MKIMKSLPMFIIKIQSWTDIITNSSTEIFCSANNIKLLKEFLNNVLHLIDPSVNIDDLVEILILPDMEKIKDFCADNEEWFEDFLENCNVDKDHLYNALDVSSNVNLAPINTYLNQFGLDYYLFCEELKQKLDDYDNYPLEDNYAFVPVNDNVNMDLIYKLNNMLHGFAEGLYDITERYC